MPKKELNPDPNQMAKRLLDIVTGDKPPEKPKKSLTVPAPSKKRNKQKE